MDTRQKKVLASTTTQATPPPQADEIETIETDKRATEERADEPR